MTPSSLTAERSVPLVLDLDHTLLRVDTLPETALLFVKRGGIGAALALPAALARGRAALKRLTAETLTDEDARHLPVNEDVVAFAAAEAARGRAVVLATAADAHVARAVARRFPFIGEVIASEGGRNLKGEAKAAALAERFPDGFIYAGDCHADLPVWARAQGACVAGGSRRLHGRLPGGPALAHFPHAGGQLDVFRRAMRVQQWAKNALVFVPQLIGGRIGDPESWAMALLGFLAIGFVSSATYILNDLLDLDEDRRHWSKRRRPLASGALSIPAGLLLMAACAIVGVACAWVAGPWAVATLALYVALSLAYSLKLKRIPLLDALTLATLFTARLALGIAVTGVPLSWWLIVFSMFLFLSLSLAKRLTEIQRMREHGHARALGRGYVAADAPLVLAFGVSATMAAVLIIVIYLIEDAFPAAVYRNPGFLWGYPLLMFVWLSRIWLLCHRGELDDDPVSFAVRDRQSLMCGAAMMALLAAAMW